MATCERSEKAWRAEKGNGEEDTHKDSSSSESVFLQKGAVYF